MLISVNYNKVHHKFHKGINAIDDINIIDCAITSFGGFTDAFNNGTGRRVELNDSEVELSVSTHASFNNKNFYFTRCYTNYRYDTSDLDKKQDIVKYTATLTKYIDSEKTILPLITYYNEKSEFEVFDVKISDLDVVNDRSYGYNNCLIVKNKFESTQQYYTLMSFIVWQKNNANIKDSYYYNYQKANHYIKTILQSIGYDGVYYDFNNEKLMVTKKGKSTDITTLDIQTQLFIAIIMDVLMRAIMLNPKKYNPFDVEGCVGITYDFDDFYFYKIIDNLVKIFPNIQILILKNR